MSTAKLDPERVYRESSPGVVTVISLFGGTLSGLLSGDQGGEGVGSGFVIDRNGEIATNAHVVTNGQGSSLKRAKSVYVQFGDGNQVPAKIVGYDANADVALIKIDPSGLTPQAAAARPEPGPCTSASRSPRSARRSTSRSRCRSA